MYTDKTFQYSTIQAHFGISYLASYSIFIMSNMGILRQYIFIYINEIVHAFPKRIMLTSPPKSFAH